MRRSITEDLHLHSMRFSVSALYVGRLKLPFPETTLAERYHGSVGLGVMSTSCARRLVVNAMISSDRCMWGTT